MVEITVSSYKKNLETNKYELVGGVDLPLILYEDAQLNYNVVGLPNGDQGDILTSFSESYNIPFCETNYDSLKLDQDQDSLLHVGKITLDSGIVECAIETSDVQVGLPMKYISIRTMDSATAIVGILNNTKFEDIGLYVHKSVDGGKHDDNISLLGGVSNSALTSQVLQISSFQNGNPDGGNTPLGYVNNQDPDFHTVKLGMKVKYLISDILDHLPFTVDFDHSLIEKFVNNPSSSDVAVVFGAKPCKLRDTPYLLGEEYNISNTIDGVEYFSGGVAISNIIGDGSNPDTDMVLGIGPDDISGRLVIPCRISALSTVSNGEESNIDLGVAGDYDDNIFFEYRTFVNSGLGQGSAFVNGKVFGTHEELALDLPNLNVGDTIDVASSIRFAFMYPDDTGWNPKMSGKMIFDIGSVPDNPVITTTYAEMVIFESGKEVESFVFAEKEYSFDSSAGSIDWLGMSVIDFKSTPKTFTPEPAGIYTSGIRLGVRHNSTEDYSGRVSGSGVSGIFFTAKLRGSHLSYNISSGNISDIGEFKKSCMLVETPSSLSDLNNKILLSAVHFGEFADVENDVFEGMSNLCAAQLNGSISESDYIYSGYQTMRSMNMTASDVLLSIMEKFQLSFKGGAIVENSSVTNTSSLDISQNITRSRLIDINLSPYTDVDYSSPSSDALGDKNGINITRGSFSDSIINTRLNTPLELSTDISVLRKVAHTGKAIKYDPIPSTGLVAAGVPRYEMVSQDVNELKIVEISTTETDGRKLVMGREYYINTSHYSKEVENGVFEQVPNAIQHKFLDELNETITGPIVQTAKSIYNDSFDAGDGKSPNNNTLYNENIKPIIDALIKSKSGALEVTGYFSGDTYYDLMTKTVFVIDEKEYVLIEHSGINLAESQGSEITLTLVEK